MDNDPKLLLRKYRESNQVAFRLKDSYWDIAEAEYEREFKSRPIGEMLPPSTWFRTVFLEGLMSRVKQDSNDRKVLVNGSTP